MNLRTKIEVADIDGYDWNWSAKYEEEVVEELTRAYQTAFVAEFPNAPLAIVQREAAEWASIRGGELITNVANTTRARVGEIVSAAIADGQSVGQMANIIRDDYIFDQRRAALVARTETATALGQGQKGAAKAQGRNEKHWVTSGDDLVSEECELNESDGWIATSSIFTGGVDTVPQHPNCRCVVRYRTAALAADLPIPPPLREFRCIECNRLLGKEVYAGTRILCKHCKIERIAEALTTKTDNANVSEI